MSTCTLVFGSTDNGISWTFRDLGSRYDLRDFAVISTDHIFAGGYGGIVPSTDNGESWLRTSYTHHAGGMVINRRDQILAAAYAGVSRSSDNGLTWSLVDAGLPNDNAVYALAFDSTGRILAGMSSGLYQSVESTTSAGETTESVPRSIRLLQNFPNPFNRSSTICYELPNTSHVVLKVFNILGHEIATLVDAAEEPGYKSVEWNASGVASGV